jgi:toxin ParE1/3/4
MAEFRLSPAAERDLEGIWKYTRREWGLEQAERYTDLLTAAFQVLAASPKSAPACDHIRQGYRRRNVERHMIYFRITDYGITIIRVLHERMDAPHHLQGVQRGTTEPIAWWEGDRCSTPSRIGLLDEPFAYRALGRVFVGGNPATNSSLYRMRRAHDLPRLGWG